ncbi:MAG: DUF4350 domain-containing protein, partial [Deltaproteobacteria bacterium]
DELDPHGVGSKLEASASSVVLPFCRDARHRLGRDERELCVFAPAAAARCPAFAAACAGTPPSIDSEFPGWLRAVGTLLRMVGFVLFWGLLLATALLLVWLAARLWGSSLPALTRSAAGEGGGTPASEPEVAEFERAFEAHLERARALAAEGRFTEAVAEVQLGVVLRLDALGHILARRGRTNGDYTRDLAQKPELQAAFGALTRTSEAVQFGGRSLDRSGFERLLQQAGPLLGALALLLGVLTLPLACQSLTPGSAAPDSPPSADGPPALSPLCGIGAEGHSLFCALFDSGAGVSQRFRPLERSSTIAQEVSAVVVLPNHLEEGAWAALQAWVEEGGVAVLSTPVESMDQRLGVSRGSAACGAQAAVLPSSERSLLVSVGPSLLAPQLRPLAVCETGAPYISEGEWGDGRVIFLPAPELLSNAGLLAGDNARLLANLLDLPPGKVEIIGSLTRDALGSPFSAVAAAGLAPWLFQLLLLCAAFAALRGTPFGRRVESAAGSRRRFSEHVQALGQRWADQRASRSALRAYASYGLELLRERVPSAAGRSNADLARAIAQKTGRPGAEVQSTLELTHRAQEGAGTGSETRDLQALRDLGRLIEDLGGPR